MKKLTLSWIGVVLKYFEQFFLTANGRPILVIDGIAIPKEGRKMPGVQNIHQSSGSNSKAEYIMGHFFQCVGILLGTPKWETVFLIPLLGRIHLGTKTSNRDKRTLFDKAVEMLSSYFKDKTFYLTGDSYYSVGKMARGVITMGSDLIVKVKSNAVAYFPPVAKDYVTRGRKRIYGLKVKLRSFFLDQSKFSPMMSPVYAEKGVKILVRTERLLSKILGDRLLLFVFVIHPTRGRMILLSTDLELSPLEAIRIYGLRFKIEVTFKVAIHSIGAFLYRFWQSDMDKTKRRQKTKYLHRKSCDYRNRYFKKLRAYEIYVQLAFISQGILQYLSIVKTKAVMDNFGSWFRTLRPGVLPTELIVKMSLKNCSKSFLAGSVFPPNLTKFIQKKVDIDSKEEFPLTG